jgi:hypothetical protein
VAALGDFDFGELKPSQTLFLAADQVIRIGLSPMRIEIMISIDGVEFEDGYQQLVRDEISGVKVKLIGLQHLERNRQAPARPKNSQIRKNFRRRCQAVR